MDDVVTTLPDPTMARIGEGMALGQRGERAAARELLAEVWAGIGEDGDPFHRCALAHAMADVQDDVREELRWDERALVAADVLTDERAAQGGVAGGVAGFYPSLHLNLAECHRKLGDVDRAREHLDRGRATLGVLPDDGYGRLIRGGYARLAERLAGHVADHAADHVADRRAAPRRQVTRARSVG